MKTVNKSVLIWYSPQEMYALVTNIAAYPQFLPWCDHSQILAEDALGVTAEVGISFGGVRQTFTTRNTHVSGAQVGMQLVKGPFSKLEGQWSFHALGDGSQRACKVELVLNYGFDNAALGALIGPVFDKIAASLVDAFVKRAQQVYGD
jgi:ribosome-associated toxin RatA of RatAB toxin-antitoxin module